MDPLGIDKSAVAFGQAVGPSVFFVKCPVVEDPKDFGLDMLFDAGNGGKTVGTDYQTVVVTVLTNIIHYGLIVGAGASQYVYFPASLFERERISFYNRIELNHIYLFDTVFEKSVYQSEKSAQAFGGNGAAYIDRYQQAC